MRLQHILPYIIFLLVLITVSQWSQLWEVLRSAGRSQAPITSFADPVLSEYIQNKTGERIPEFRLVHSDKPFAAMTGVPGNPQLFISSMLYETFDQQATEYILLHELGHYQRNHTVRELLWVVGLVVLGTIILKRSKINLPKGVLGLVLGVIMGISLIQIGRGHEYEADWYALSKLDHPQAMVTATENLQKYATRAPRLIER